MAEESRLRFTNPSPSKVPIARISELFDDDYLTPVGDRNHESVPSMNRSQPPNANNSETAPNHSINEGDATPTTKNGGDKGCNPIYPQLCAYFGSAVLFLLGMNVSGLTLLSYPWVGNMLWYDYQNISFPDGVIVLQFMWCGHYVRRFAEVLYVHIYRRKMPFFESIGASVYYWTFGFWIGWSVNFNLGYRVPALVFFIPGVLFFLIGGDRQLLHPLAATPHAVTALRSDSSVRS